MLYTKQHNEASTETLYFQVKIASFYELSAKAEYQLIAAVSKTLKEQSKDLGFLVDTVTLQKYTRDSHVKV